MKKEETMTDLPLGDRMKKYEKQFEDRIPYNNFIVVRCDGHKFSKYTKGMKKPFDVILANSMVETTKDLVEKFGAVTGYVQSDEITLIFAPQFKEKQNVESEIVNEQIFGGRIQKMASLLASYTTMRFNINFAQALKDEQLKVKRTPDNFEFYNKMEEKVGNAWFDARLYGVKSKDEAYNSLMWRVRDAEKNSRSMFAHTNHF
jgi:tRNA(His) 5'-end guanylyltransferase